MAKTAASLMATVGVDSTPFSAGMSRLSSIAAAGGKRAAGAFNSAMSRLGTVKNGTMSSLGTIKGGANFALGYAGVNAGLGAVKGSFGALGSAVSSTMEGMKQFTLSGIDGAAKMETAATEFEVLTKSATVAKSVLGQIKDLANNTPMEFPELVDAGRKLLAFGESAGTVTKTLSRIGDLSSGVGAPVGEIAELFGKARVQGTLMAEDINQLTGRGIPVIQEFAKQLGVSTDQVKELGSQGKIKFANLEKALVSMTSAGGNFFEMMEKKSKTFEGLTSTMADAWKEMQRSMGEPLVAALKPLIKSASDAMAPLAKSFAELGGEMARSITDSMPAIKAALDGTFSQVAKAAMPGIKTMLSGVTTQFLRLSDTARQSDWGGAIAAGITRSMPKISKAVVQISQVAERAIEAGAEGAPALMDAIIKAVGDAVDWCARKMNELFDSAKINGWGETMKSVWAQVAARASDGLVNGAQLAGNVFTALVGSAFSSDGIIVAVAMLGGAFGKALYEAVESYLPTGWFKKKVYQWYRVKHAADYGEGGDTNTKGDAAYANWGRYGEDFDARRRDAVVSDAKTNAALVRDGITTGIAASKGIVSAVQASYQPTHALADTADAQATYFRLNGYVKPDGTQGTWDEYTAASNAQGAPVVSPVPKKPASRSSMPPAANPFPGAYGLTPEQNAAIDLAVARGVVGDYGITGDGRLLSSAPAAASAPIDRAPVDPEVRRATPAGDYYTDPKTGRPMLTAPDLDAATEKQTSALVDKLQTLIASVTTLNENLAFGTT